jgi:hypothetical protein
VDRSQSATVLVRGGLGRLRLHVHGADAAVVMDEQPVAMVWMRQGDASDRWFVRAHDLGAMEDELTLPDTGSGEPLPTLLREVLAMMPDGRYRLGMQASPDLDPDQPATDDAERSSGEVLAWTGLHRVRSDDPLLLGTVPRDLLDRAQIRALSARINRGARPPVVLVEAPEQGVSFIVAGHTALEAYRRVAMEPVLLTIEPLDPDPLSEDAGAALLNAAFARCGDVVAAEWRAMRESQSAVADVG